MIMMLATPTAPTRRATAPRPKKRPSNAPWASAWATRASRRLGHVDLAWVLRVGGGAEEVVDGVDVGGPGPHVDAGRVAVEAQVVLRGREADEDRRVDVGGRARPASRCRPT